MQLTGTPVTKGNEVYDGIWFDFNYAMGVTDCGWQ